MCDTKKYQQLFAERLRTLRDEKKYTQEYLAAKLDISVLTLSRLENGTTKPKFDTIVKLSNIFDISIDYLVGMSDNRKKSKLTKGRIVSAQKTVVKEEPPINMLEFLNPL